MWKIGFIAVIMFLIGACADHSTASAACALQKLALPFTDTVSWDTYPSPTDTLTILRGTVSGGPYSQIGSVPATTSSFVDNTITQTGTYFYVVTAFDGSQTSVNSNEACVTFFSNPDAPSLLDVSRLDD